MGFHRTLSLYPAVACSFRAFRNLRPLEASTVSSRSSRSNWRSSWPAVFSNMDMGPRSTSSWMPTTYTSAGLRLEYAAALC